MMYFDTLELRRKDDLQELLDQQLQQEQEYKGVHISYDDYYRAEWRCVNERLSVDFQESAWVYPYHIEEKVIQVLQDYRNCQRDRELLQELQEQLERLEPQVLKDYKVFKEQRAQQVAGGYAAFKGELVGYHLTTHQVLKDLQLIQALPESEEKQELIDRHEETARVELLERYDAKKGGWA